MRIVVLDGYTLNPGDHSWEAIEALGETTIYDRTAPGQILTRARNAEIVLTNKTPLDAATLAQLPDLKFISVLATGFNIVDVQAARDRGILVANVPEYGTDSVAQQVFAMLLSFTHRCRHHDQLVRAGEWQRRQDFCFWDTPLVELTGKRMGIVGFGRIGRRVGQLAHAFNMNVAAFDIAPQDPPDYTPFAWKSVEAIFSESDVVTLHCPLTKENAGMVNQPLLSKMKRSAWFINTARGGLVDEHDLADALTRGTIAGAALDVLSTEPVSTDNPLLHAPNCLITPHTAWATVEARQRLMAVTAENVSAFLNNRPRNLVN